MSVKRFVAVLTVVLVGIVIFVVLIRPTGADQVDRQRFKSDELGAHGGVPCPAVLPADARKSDRPAAARPNLAVPSRAWTCDYELRPRGWTMVAGPVEIDSDQMTDLHRALSDLTPANPDRACTADFGPRTMVVTSLAGDLTGVIIDRFGCLDVLLTDEPFDGAPGGASQSGTVPGQLGGGQGVLDQVSAAS